MSIRSCTVCCVLVDTGSVANVLFWPAFEQMGLDPTNVMPNEILLIVFGAQNVNSIGLIYLLVVIHETEWETEFLIVDAPSSYNRILGRPTPNKLKAKVSTYSFTLEVCTVIGPFAIHGNC